MDKGFTLIELLIVLAMIGALVAVVALGVVPLVDKLRTRAQALELSRIEEALDIFVVMDGDAITPRETPAPIQRDDTDAPFGEYLGSLPSRYAYAWDATGHVSQYLFEEAGELMLTSLGNTPSEISLGILTLMQAYYADHEHWARTWSPYRYTDLGLDADFWDKTIEGIHYGPNGGYLGLANVSGDDAQVYVQTTDGHEIHLYDGWSIWLSAIDGLAYYHNYPRGLPGEVLVVVDLSTLRVEFAP